MARLFWNMLGKSSILDGVHEIDGPYQLWLLLVLDLPYKDHHNTGQVNPLNFISCLISHGMEL